MDGDGRGDGSGRLDNEFETFPESAHGGENFFLSDESDFVDMFTENRKCERAESGAKAVGNGFGFCGGLDFAGGEGAVSVVGIFRFSANHANLRAHGFRGDGSTAEETAAADGRNDDVEVGNVFEQFDGCGALAGDDLRIVVRMNQHGAGFFLEDFAGGVARSDAIFAFGDAAAVGFDGLTLGAGRGAGHDDPRGNTPTAGGERNGCGMISRRYSDDAALRLFVGERENGVGGAAEFKRAGFLQILALEKQVRAGHVVDGFRGEDGSAMNMRLNARVS